MSRRQVTGAAMGDWVEAAAGRDATSFGTDAAPDHSTRAVAAQLCGLCQGGRRAAGEVTRTFAAGDTGITIAHVPARVCNVCGDAVIDPVVVEQVVQLVKSVARLGISAFVDFRASVAPV